MTSIDLERRLRAAADDAHRVAGDLAPRTSLDRLTDRAGHGRWLAPALVLTGVAVTALVIVLAQPATPPGLEIAGPEGADQPSETPPPEPEPEPETETVAGCSAAGLPPEVEPQPELPDEVAQLRAELAQLAVVCDFDGLAGLTHPTEFTYSFGHDAAPADYWRRAEASDDGKAPMEALRRVLDAPSGTYETDSAGAATYWVWPRLAALDPQQTDDADLGAAIDEAVATGVHPREEVEGMVHDFGAYLGYRVLFQVPADGTEAHWVVFVAGD